MAASILYLRFLPARKLRYNFYNNIIIKLCPCEYQQQQTFTSTSGCMQATPVESLPGYNHRLPGKGKSRASIGHKWTPNIKGDVLFGIHPIYLALKAKRRKSFYCLHINEKFGNDNVHVHPMLDQIHQLASEENIPVKWVRKRDLDLLAGNRPHQGVCLDAEELDCPSWSETIAPDWCSQDPPLWLFLQNIQDPMNFGAILRSSYFIGVDKVIVPKDNSCKLSPVVSKSSSGVLEVVDLLKLPQNVSGESFCKWWKSHDGMVLGTYSSTTGPDEDNVKCTVLQDFTMSRPSLLVLGNEGTGLSKDIAKMCDVRLHIQNNQTGYWKEIDSLNVSVATGILLHWLQTTKLQAGD